METFQWVVAWIVIPVSLLALLTSTTFAATNSTAVAKDHIKNIFL